MAALIFAEPGSSQRQHVLRGDRTTIGRHGENDLVLGDTLVSRRHCIIEGRSTGHVLVDLSSTYGTYLNEERVEGAKPLTFGDKIRVGKTTMRFSEEAENTKTATTSQIIEQHSTDGGTRKQPSLAKDLTEARMLAESVLAYVKKQSDAAATENVQRLITRLISFDDSLAEMEQNRVLAQTLGAVGQIINQVTDLDLVLRITMDHGLRALGAERGYILLRDGDSGTLSVRMTRNMGDIRGFSQSIAERVIASGKSILTTDAQVDPRFSKAQSVMINAIRAVMCVPLRGKNVDLADETIDEPRIDFIKVYVDKR